MIQNHEAIARTQPDLRITGLQRNLWVKLEQKAAAKEEMAAAGALKADMPSFPEPLRISHPDSGIVMNRRNILYLQH